MTSSPTLDGYATSDGTSTSTSTVTLTTTKSNDIIVIATVTTENPESSVTGISGGGLTFQQRSKITHFSNSQYNTLEVWWALAASPLSSVALEVAFSESVEDLATLAFAVNGCNTSAPWDPNVSLPATAISSNPPSASCSTSNADDFYFMIVANQFSSTFPGTMPSGFTEIGGIAENNGAASACVVAAYKSVDAVQSGTVSWGSNIGSILPISYLDALTADSIVAAKRPPVQCFVIS